MPAVSHAISAGSHSISIKGIKQGYHVFGQGPICIALSGGPGIEWTYLRMPELERHLTIIYLEPIGTGASGRLAQHPNGYGVARYSEQVQSFLSALNLEAVLVLGHSHGGFVAQHLALHYPERLAGLVLYDTSPVTGAAFMEDASRNIGAFVEARLQPKDIQTVMTAWRSIPQMKNDGDYTAVMRDLLPAYFGDDRRIEIVARLRPAIRAWLVSGDTEPFDVRTRLPALDKPVLVLVGAHDFICGPRWAAMLHDLIPGAQLVTFGRSGHFAHLEQEADFADAVVSFSDELAHRSKATAELAPPTSREVGKIQQP